MSAIRSPSATSAPSNFEAIFIASIEKYSKQTKKDLREHPLASRIDACKSAEEILAIFRDQAKEFSDIRNGDPKLIKCLEPIIGCLYDLSASPVLSTAVGLVSSGNLICFFNRFSQSSCHIGVPPCISNLLWDQCPSVRGYPSTLYQPALF